MCPALTFGTGPEHGEDQAGLRDPGEDEEHVGRGGGPQVQPVHQVRLLLY